ncbi:recombinase family protein [Salmonella enterica]|nr:recombinase family protein [Salmonella enterica]ECF5935031.1 recombinase family protein [Salmonella enterica subsp. diarizonae]EBJ3543161.1 recombinase family protein [Salmonella enterica]EBN1566500.1 recombinase family protein [Salmonella enterica]EEE1294557.1 recombinase family protein [Salmonella enterica subsp. diarizonae]
MDEVNVAQYLRMSTDHQQYSIFNQSQFISKFASEHKMNIIHTYDDSGKSGVTANRRQAFQQLIDDVVEGKINIKAVLVYDISRFGRFQSIDQFGYYTHQLQMHGVGIIYCANPIIEGNSDYADFQLFIDRKKASSLSRDLSQKVFLGQANLAGRGYHQGGPAGYGLRRMLIDENHKHKGILKYREWKSIQTDRIILVLGPEDEVITVRWIYDQFVNNSKPERVIASELDRRGIAAEHGTKWTRGKIHEILTNEKYIGHNVYNRTSSRLKQRLIHNPQHEWIRCDNAFEAIISPELFLQAQEIIRNRSIHLSNEDLLCKLSELFKAKGKLSGIIIDEDDESPSSSVYRKRFGGLLQAYQLINYRPKHDYDYLRVNSLLREKYHVFVEKLIFDITAQGCYVDYNEETKLFTINDEFKISVVISRCFRKSNKSRWKIRFERKYSYDACIVVRLDSQNASAKDYYIFPSIEVLDRELVFESVNPFQIEFYRFDSLEPFLQILERIII